MSMDIVSLSQFKEAIEAIKTTIDVAKSLWLSKKSGDRDSVADELREKLSNAQSGLLQLQVAYSTLIAPATFNTKLSW